MSWLVVSVGLGTEDFNQAAERVAYQASSISLFDKCIALNETDIHRLIPELKSRLFNENGVLTVGYGFYSWKSRISKLALSGEFGDYDNLLIVDAGCEIFKSPASQLLLQSYMSQAVSQGVLAFAISTPESLFTKKELFESFPNLDRNDTTDQFQSGILYFSGPVGREAVRLWDDVVWSKINNVNDALDNEQEGFCAHRHDQSVLSLVLKSMGIKPAEINPMGLPKGFRSTLGCFIEPIWWTRNRTGKSQIPPFLKLIGTLSEKLPESSAHRLIRLSRFLNGA